MQNDKIYQVPVATYHRRSHTWLPLLITALLAAAGPIPVAAQEVDMAKLEAALLAENWQEVADLLKVVTDDPQKSPNPVLRLIKGHVCLALNRNNESVCLFLSVFRDENLAQYNLWATHFSEKNTAHVNSRICRYFLCDSFARQGRWDDALSAFDKAGGFDMQHPLLFNARGLVYAAQGKCDEALVDFCRAVELAPSFADAHANHGILNIQRSAGAEGALIAFDRALNISPTYSLALVGRGCVHLVLYSSNANTAKQNHALAAQEDFAKAKQYGGCAIDIIAENIRRLMAHLKLVPKTDYSQLSKDDLGTTLEKLQTEVFQNPTQDNVNEYTSALSTLRHTDPNEYAKQMTTLQMASRTLPDWQQEASPFFAHNQKWNAPGGGAEAWGNLVPDGLSILGNGVSGVDGTTTMNQNTHDNFKSATDVLDNIGRPSSMSTNPFTQGQGAGTWNGGGVTASLDGMRMEDGNWPFVAYYGLCYPRTLEQDYPKDEGENK